MKKFQMSDEEILKYFPEAAPKKENKNEASEWLKNYCSILKKYKERDES